MEKSEKEKQTVYIRKDGWLISEEGRQRLVEGGHKGHRRYMESVESQIGKWHRISQILDRDAADIIKGVKGVAARAAFVSGAVLAEIARRKQRGAS